MWPSGYVRQRTARGRDRADSAAVELNTYRSRAQPDVFVTMPTREAAALTTFVEELLALRLIPLCSSYPLSRHARDMPFLEFVTAQIALRGYAIHGFVRIR